jgi:5-(carboxyamino)imidazole ribonucleotide mutase
MKVAIIMGSMSDLAKVEPAITILKKFDVNVNVRCLSAHRSAKELEEFINESNSNGTEVFIGAAGMAAALPGVIASMTVLPVIGLPISGSTLDGMDALLSIVQMPPGIPVATVAINGAKNAAYLALEIMAIKYPTIKEKLLQDRLDMKNAILKNNEELINKY